jgi:hypothetical protein
MWFAHSGICGQHSPASLWLGTDGSRVADRRTSEKTRLSSPSEDDDSGVTERDPPDAEPRHVISGGASRCHAAVMPGVTQRSRGCLDRHGRRARH